MTGFDEKLRQGRLGESLIARWLMRRGFSVLPAYEVERGNGKGPRIFSMAGELVSPDLFVFKQGDGKVLWVEAKSKAAFTWHRISHSYQDGIDVRHWNDYSALRRRIDWPLWLLFLHGPGHVAKDNPPSMIPPTGLFGGEITRLATCIDHRSDRWGSGGMVYWRCEDLMAAGKPLATYEEVCIKAEA